MGATYYNNRFKSFICLIIIGLLLWFISMAGYYYVFYFITGYYYLLLLRLLILFIVGFSLVNFPWMAHGREPFRAGASGICDVKIDP